MILFLKILALSCCILIAGQDFRERAVYWFLFPLLAVILGALHYAHATPSFFCYAAVTNMVLTTLIIGVLYLFAKYIIEREFMNHSMGLGDILFFYAISLGFPSITFIVLFASSVLFSLISFIILNKNRNMETVPLAGLMSIFFIVVLTYSLFFESPSLYII